MNEKSIELLKAAKERLFTTGWQKGGYGQKQGPNCILGALYHEREAFEVCDYYKTRMSLLGFINCWPSVAQFNDAPETTFDEVVHAIDKAIKNLEIE